MLLHAGTQRHHGRGRHGEHDATRPTCCRRRAAALRLGHGEVKDHMFLDGLEDAYDKGRLMGTFAEDCAASISSRARRRTPSRSTSPHARAGRRTRTARSPSEIVAGARCKAEPAREVARDEQPFKADLRQDPQAQARVPQGRHGHGGQLQLDLRRRRGAGADARGRGREARACRRSPGSSAHATHAQAPAWFTTAPVGAIRKLLEQGRLERERRRPLRDQRGVRGRRDGRDARPRPAARQGQRARRRLRARPSDRRLRRAHPRDAARRAGKHGAKRGVAALCIGGGEATAIALERITD